MKFTKNKKKIRCGTLAENLKNIDWKATVSTVVLSLKIKYENHKYPT